MGLHVGGEVDPYTQWMRNLLLQHQESIVKFILQQDTQEPTRRPQLWIQFHSRNADKECKKLSIKKIYTVYIPPSYEEEDLASDFEDNDEYYESIGILDTISNQSTLESLNIRYFEKCNLDHQSYQERFINLAIKNFATLKVLDLYIKNQDLDNNLVYWSGNSFKQLTSLTHLTLKSNRSIIANPPIFTHLELLPETLIMFKTTACISWDSGIPTPPFNIHKLRELLPRNLKILEMEYKPWFRFQNSNIVSVSPSFEIFLKSLKCVCRLEKLILGKTEY